MLPNRDIVGRAQPCLLRRLHDDRLFPVGWLHFGVVDLAVLEIGEADRPVVRPSPAFIGDDPADRAVLQRQLKLRKDACLRAENIRHAVGRDASAIPAVRKAQLDFVLFLK